ncbi:MAG: 50S ribosomal protein L29 [Flavobacteriales bacterium]|nr:50S ribosomal protein L29 [Flavobacteriales bacterium]MCB9165978.1 50S ribosomal protein L29 [Flavobacteriales bacterium]
MKKQGTELKDLTLQELQDKLQEERDTLRKMRFDHAVSPVDNPMKMRVHRKEVARVLTEMRAREIKQNKQ